MRGIPPQNVPGVSRRGPFLGHCSAHPDFLTILGYHLVLLTALWKLTWAGLFLQVDVKRKADLICGSSMEEATPQVFSMKTLESRAHTLLVCPSGLLYKTQKRNSIISSLKISKSQSPQVLNDSAGCGVGGRQVRVNSAQEWRRGGGAKQDWRNSAGETLTV